MQPLQVRGATRAQAVASGGVQTTATRAAAAASSSDDDSDDEMILVPQVCYPFCQPLEPSL